jgi:hypothetical protein
LGVALCAALSGAGCADLSRAIALSPDPVDSQSPVAGQVQAATRTDYERPSFRDVPPAPTDIRPAPAWRSAVDQSVQAGQAVTAWVAANPTLLTGPETESFAAAQRARIPASERQAAPVDPAGTEDFAARLRALAAPPPPPK